MKTLFLVRHAKSSRDDPGLPDRERPLAERGRRDVEKMGKRLAERGVKPELILTSPALRALATAQAIAGRLDCRHQAIEVDERLYACPADDVLEVIQRLGDQLKRVMLVGHNPELVELANRLSAEIVEMPTCAIAEFKFASGSWADVGRIAPVRVSIDYPKKT